MTRIYMIRHGESLSNLAGTFTGSLNSPLSETGIMQARLITAYFDNIQVDAVYSSDLDRAKNTVLKIAEARGLEVISTPLFREINGGHWEGRIFSEIEEMYKEEYAVWRQDIGHSRCSGGESAKELAQRVLDGILKIAKENEGKSVVIGTHATPIRAAEAVVTLGTSDRMNEVPWVPNASISLYSYQNGKLHLEKRGETDHLEGYITKLPKNV